jgi:hypothetical protein
MTSQQTRNQKLKQQLGFDYTSILTSLPPQPFVHPFAEQEEKPPPTYPAHFAPGDIRTHKPAVPKDFDLSSLTFGGYKALNLNFAQEHELIGRIRDGMPLVDRDEVDHMILADAASILANGVFSLCRVMHIDPKVVKMMLGVQFKKFYGPKVDQEVTAALASINTARGDTPETMGNVEVANKVRKSSPAAERSRANGQSTAFAELAKKKIKHSEAETMEDKQIADNDGLEASVVDKPTFLEVETMPPLKPPKKKIKHAEPVTIKEIVTSGLVVKENTTQALAPPNKPRQSMSRENNVGESDDIHFVNENARHQSVVSQRSQAATPTPGTKKKAKRRPRTAAQVASSAHKGQQTRKGFKSCVATLRSKQVAEEWETLLKKPKLEEIAK